jgi:hypothetical protein
MLCAARAEPCITAAVIWEKRYSRPYRDGVKDFAAQTGEHEGRYQAFRCSSLGLLRPKSQIFWRSMISEIWCCALRRQSHLGTVGPLLAEEMDKIIEG